MDVDNEPSFSRFCECGNRKSCSAASCTRCRFLDGGGSAERDAIDALNDADGPLTSTQIATASGASENSIDGALLKLLKTGRVKRAWDNGHKPYGAFVYWAVVP